LGPLKFIPILKRLRWGGRRLGSVLNKPLGPFADYAESWEICDHGADQSVVENGRFRGRCLHELVCTNPSELLGRHRGLPQFPLLLKFLDAHDRLSLQVHPNDEQARRFVPDERGKTEAWVILQADPGSCVFAGLRSNVDERELRAALHNGTVENHLHRLEVTAGDCLFIPAGTVHAIGEGILLAEVQQSSDVTFRLSDWNRLGTDGKPRALHIEQSLACIDFGRGPVNPVVPASVRNAEPNASEAGCCVEELVNCPHFIIRRHSLSQPATLPADERCRILMGLTGRVECQGTDECQTLDVGDTVLVPASALPVHLHPAVPSVLLEVFWD
jgi:mannose-6-phosphate isomerase